MVDGKEVLIKPTPAQPHAAPTITPSVSGNENVHNPSPVKASPSPTIGILKGANGGLPNIPNKSPSRNQTPTPTPVGTQPPVSLAKGEDPASPPQQESEKERIEKVVEEMSLSTPALLAEIKRASPSKVGGHPLFHQRLMVNANAMMIRGRLLRIRLLRCRLWSIHLEERAP